MAKCKRCGKSQFLRKGICYSCHKIENNASISLPITKRTTRQYAPISEYEDAIINIAKRIGRKINILVIDQAGPIVLESFKLILKIVDINVITAENGKDGLNLLTPDIDMVFCDLMISKEMNGIDAMKKIKERYPNMPVVIETAYCSDALYKEALRNGALDFLSKPFLMEDIYKLVLKGLNLRGY